MHELERLEKLLGGGVHVGIRGDLLLGRLAHVQGLHLHPALVQPAADGHQKDAIRLIIRAATLEVELHAVVGLLGEDLLARRTRLEHSSVLLHLVAHLA